MGLIGTATLFSYISKFVAYLLIGVVVFLDLILLLGSYGLLGSPTFNASSGGGLTITARHLLQTSQSYVFDSSPFVNPIHALQYHFNTSNFLALNNTVSFSSKFNLGMAYSEVSKLYNITLQQLNALESDMTKASTSYATQVSTALTQYSGTVSQSTVNAMSQTPAVLTKLRALILSLTGACCSAPSLSFVTSSDTHTQPFQTQFAKIQASLSSYQISFPTLVQIDVNGYISAVNSFGTRVTGFASSVAKDLTTWLRFKKWFLGANHQNWQYTPLSSFDFGTPVPQLVKDIAASVHGLAIFLALSLFIAIFSRTARTIYNFSELAEAAKTNPKIETGVSTSVSIGAAGELRKRTTHPQDV
jgi:hypothetical protein